MAEISELSLYHLDNELLGLLAYRDERLSDTEDPPSPEELETVDGLIKQYMEALPAKVSGVAAIFRFWRGQITTIKAEAERLAGLRRSIETREAWLKEMVGFVLSRQPEPKKGCKKLIGADGSQLMLKGNGGVQPLEITAELVPDEYQDATVKLPMPAWLRMCAASPLTGSEGAEVEFSPSNARIREALAEDCPRCGGNGVVEAGEETEAESPCKECGGSGNAGVPGCRLLDRGSSVIVK